MLTPYKRFSVLLVLCLGLVVLGAYSALAQTPLKTVNSAEGGRIMYGVVDGATNQAAGMASVLRAVHSNCGERPQVGRLFHFRGTETVGVFFTVVDHQAGNAKVAGLALAAMSGSNRVEAALVSDSAARFGSTVNPMLQELLAEWHPGVVETTTGHSTDTPTGGHLGVAEGHSGPVARLHEVTAPDNSESIGLPDEWNLDPHSGRGTAYLSGPQGEWMALGLNKTGVDPTHPWQVNFTRMGGRPLPGQMVYPYKGKLIRVFPDMLQAWRRSNGQSPAKLQVDKIEPTPTPLQGEECVTAEGHVDPDGQGMRAMSEMMCASLIPQWGGFSVRRYQSGAPDSAFEKEKNLRTAVIASWKLNEEVIKGQWAGDLRQKQASDDATRAWGQQQVANINQIGANASIRMQATQQMHDMQNQSFEQHEDSISRNGQGFSNYLLDQTVVQDNNMYNNGTLGHGTVWNSTADALVKADPNRFEIVETPNFWRGIDY